MIFKNLKFFIRSFRKDKSFVVINLFGLTAGILVALLAVFYAFYQLSYDKFIVNHKNIYRIEYIRDLNGDITPEATCSANLANVLKAEVPGIEDLMIVSRAIKLNLVSDEKPFKLDSWIMASPNFLDYYNIKFIAGTRESSLVDSKSLIITESLAAKYFADQDPIGKQLIIKFNNYTRFIISGVIKDLPPNSHIQTEAIALSSPYWSENSNEDIYDQFQLVYGFDFCYLILAEHASIDSILEYFSSIKEKYMASFLEENGMDLELVATNITDTHFKQNLLYDFPAENLNSIYYFLLVALMVILISIINYINLSLARHTNRNVDIGIRKTLGATKSNIFYQYLSESFLFLFISCVVAFIIFMLVLSLFSHFIGIDLGGAEFSYSNLLLLIPIFFLLAFFTGLYPALITAGKNPIEILHNKKANQKHAGKQFFVIIQMILSIIFFIGTMTIFLQMRYVENVDKGYDIENVIAYEYYNYGSSMPTCAEICEKLKESAYIKDVAVSTKLPGQDAFIKTVKIQPGSNMRDLDAEIFNIDENYLSFMNIRLLSGRNFNKNLSSDSEKVIVNESFARNFINIEAAIGSSVQSLNLVSDVLGVFDAEIIGVVRDFHFQSIHDKIRPMVLTNRDFAPNFYNIKYDTRNLKYVTEHSQKVFDDYNSPFATIQHFPKEELLKKYDNEQHLSEMTIWLAVLSILLAILGVFGLTAFVVRNNMKMLSIRKVFGAEKKDLFKLMLRDYSFVLIISNMVAVPLAWFICIKWLERFAYRISLPVWLFASGITMSFLIVFLAVSYHVFKVNKTNPVEYLLDE